jgi:cell division protease FtsH
LIWNFSTNFQTRDREVTFSEFMQRVETGQVAQVTIAGNRVTGVGKDGDRFRTFAPDQYEGLGNRLIDRNVVVMGEDAGGSPWSSMLYYWAPVLLMIGFWIFIMRQMQSGGNKALSFGKSRAPLLLLAEEDHLQGRSRRRRGKG